MDRGRKLKILGAGSPLVDLLAGIEESFLDRVAGEKGGMMMVAPDEQELLIAALPTPPVTAPGGAAGNTVFTLVRLGVDAAMLGKIGNDAAGDFYRRRLAELGGDASEFIVTDAAATGRCLSLITPDSERTMRSHLGASQLLTVAEVERVDFSRYDLFYIESYMLFLDGVFETAVRQAKKAGCRVAIDLASFEVVRIFREKLLELIGECVDMVFANELEAAELLGGDLSEEELALTLGGMCDVAALKLGRRGSIVVCDGRATVIAPVTVENPLDTTAAGDTWAAGFLFGLLEGKSPLEAGRIASLLASEVVKVFGSELNEEQWKYVRSQL